MAAEPFTFGIPLIARDAARDWERVEALFDLNLASLRAQTDQDFRIIVAGHDRPRAGFDARLRFLAADWPAAPVRADNLDSGRKKHAINERVCDGGGLLMFLDADDWVDVRLVEAARATIGPHHAGGLIATGFASDFRSLGAICLSARLGSSSVDPDPGRSGEWSSFAAGIGSEGRGRRKLAGPCER